MFLWYCHQMMNTFPSEPEDEFFYLTKNVFSWKIKKHSLRSTAHIADRLPLHLLLQHRQKIKSSMPHQRGMNELMKMLVGFLSILEQRFWTSSGQETFISEGNSKNTSN